MHTKGRNPNYWMVDVHSKKGYQGARLYMTKDRRAGVAITKDGNITSVFSRSNERGMMAKLITFAVARGGRKLDCFAGGLQNMYARFGAKAVAQTLFNPEYAPKGWDGRHLPVVGMVLPKTVSGVIRAYKKGASVNLRNVPNYPDYDSMLAARDAFIDRSNSIMYALRTAKGSST